MLNYSCSPPVSTRDVPLRLVELGVSLDSRLLDGLEGGQKTVALLPLLHADALVKNRELYT